MKRREFISTASAAAIWPLATYAQPASIPVLGVLVSVSRKGFEHRILAFRQGLRDGGYLEGQNVHVDYRWAESQQDELPALAADLVRRSVSAIATLGGPSSALAAQAATKTIPIIFGVPDDPVKLGLVTSLARPGGNVTGVNFLTGELMGKRFEFMQMLIPGLRRVVVLIHSANRARADEQSFEVDKIGRSLGIEAQIFRVETASDIEAVFAKLERQKPDAIIVAPAPFFAAQGTQLAQLAAKYALPASYSDRASVQVGGLISYGANINDAYREIGIYTSRVLKGEKPADIPVLLPTKYELVINLKTAKSLGVQVPMLLQQLADEVIE
jgi:putative ABC transport system substrate-binding protein